MKKLGSWKALENGKIYNKVYVGDNEAFARINGKNTFMVVETNPLKTQDLFDQFGDPFTSDIRNGVCTHPNPQASLSEFDLYLVEEESEYFIKSQIMTLQEALCENLITVEEIKRQSQYWTNNFDGTGDTKYYHSFRVEGRSKENPYLQSVIRKMGIF